MSDPQLFADNKFWVAQRVPNRKDLCDDIRKHGGKVVRLEKQADILIADCSRNDSPSGAYSHRLIQDSIKNGSFQIPDRYRLADSPRAAGSARPGKTFRAAFDHEEDARLATFVLANPSGQGGNVLYQEFAELNPSHTWQSWRNRWVKKLKLLPEGVLREMVKSVSDDEPAPRRDPSPAQQQPVDQASPPQQTSVNNEVAEGQEVEGAQGHGQHNDDEEGSPSEVVDNIDGEDDQSAQEGQDDELEFQAQRNFYRLLSDFAQANGLEEQIEPHHTIGDKDFGLYELLIAHVHQGVEPSEINFDEIASYLGLDSEDPDVAAQLKTIWDQNLQAFMEDCYMDVLKGDTASDGENSEDADQRRSPTLDTHQDSPSRPVDPSPPQKSSPPPANTPSQPGPSQKRSQHQSQALPSRKRRRLSPNAEIPSTPDEALGVVRPSIEDEQGEQQKGQSQKLSSSVQRRLFRVEVKDSQEDSQAAFTQAKTPGRRRSTQRPKEPIVLQTQTTGVDVTPSQQLHGEEAFASSVESKKTTMRRNASRSSPTPKEVVPRTQVSTQDRIPNPSKSPLKTRAPPRVNSPRYVPPAVVPPKRTLPTSFAHNAPPSAIKATREKAPAPRSASTNRLSPTATSSHRAQVNNTHTYDPDSQDPLNEPPARPRLTSGLSTLDDWINHYQAFYPRPIVIIGLKATTMTPGGQAAETMESLKQGRGIPSNYEGVWTDRDDRGLAAVDRLERELGEELYVARGSSFKAKNKGTLDRRGKMRKEKARLMDKHGLERMKMRLRFLEADRKDGMA